MEGLFRVLNLGLAVDTLQNTNNAKQTKVKKPFLNRVVSFVLKTIILIELIKYIFTGIFFSCFLLINNIKAIFGLTEKSQVYVESAESVNRLYGYIGQIIDSVDLQVIFDNEPNNEQLENVEDNIVQNVTLSDEVSKTKEDAVTVLKRLRLINVTEDNYLELSFNVSDFRSLNMSLKNIDDIHAISQIYAFELAVREYNPSAIDDYYRGIKCKYEDRYYEGKDDFINSIGCSDEFEYRSIAEGYIVSKNGDISISGANNIRLSSCSNKYSFRYSNEDKGEPLVDILNAKKQEQADNMKKAALGIYKVRKHTF